VNSCVTFLKKKRIVSIKNTQIIGAKVKETAAKGQPLFLFLGKLSDKVRPVTGKKYLHFM
jgi:hypothetical protein